MYVCVCVLWVYTKRATDGLGLFSSLPTAPRESTVLFNRPPTTTIFLLSFKETDFQQTIIVFSFSGGIPADGKGENSAGKIWPNYTQLPILLAI